MRQGLTGTGVNLLSEDELATLLSQQRRVYLQNGAAEPQDICRVLVKYKERFNNLELYSTPLPMNKLPFIGRDFVGHLRLVSFFGGSKVDEGIKLGQVDYIPCHLSKIPATLELPEFQFDASLVLVTSPDASGYVNLGANVDYVRTAMRRSRLVIAEMNPNVPWTNGETRVHCSEIDYFFSSQASLAEIPSVKVGEVERLIGKNVAQLVTDGATVQTGVGSIAEAVLASLAGKKDLGIHSGLISDTMVELVRDGTITGKKKNLHPGRLVAPMLVGSQKVYKFAHCNPLIHLYPVAYTHNIKTLAQIENFIAINSALQIDLSGQVNCECLDGSYARGGIGGIVDFLRGAAEGPGGVAIVALPSTAQKGSVSRIVPRLPDALVTVPRTDVQFVVTEWGIADLRGRSLSERARLLAAIAHPDFRQKLLAFS